MISPEQMRLAFLKLELKECCYLIYCLKNESTAIPNPAKELKHWEAQYKILCDKVFELEVLLGVEV